MSDVKGSAAGGGAVPDLFGLLARFAPLIFLVVLMAVFAVMEPRFLSALNLFNIMRQVSITGLLAVGMTFIILTAGIDLSIGSLLGALRARRRGGRQGRVPGALLGRSGGRGGRLRLGGGGPRRHRHRACRRPDPGPCHHPPQGAALRRDARRDVGVPRRRAAFRRRRPDQRLSARLYLVGAGADRPGPRPGDHLRRLRHPRPRGAALYALWPARSTRSAATRRRRGSPG